MNSKLLFVFAISCSLSAFSQQTFKIKRCSQLDAETHLQQKNPNRLAEREAYQKELDKWIANNPYDYQKTRAVINIPVVLHVLWNAAVENISDAQVLSAIKVLNDDFNRTNADASTTPSLFAPLGGVANINWCMATVDPNGNPTNGIIHKKTTKTGFDTDDGAKKNSTGGDDAWPTNKYFNIWVVKFTDPQLLGYGEFPTGTQSQTHGFCATYTAYGTIGTAAAPFDKGRTATHEIGHCFNLAHIWGDEAQCAADDGVTDTPKQKGENYGVPTFPQGTSETGGCCTASDQSSMFMNYMDYTDDAAMNIFTKGQVTKMLAVLNTAPYNGYKTSTGCGTSVGMNELNSPTILKISPNPTSGNISITFNSSLDKNAIIHVKNILGESIHTISLNGLEDNVNLDLSHQVNGIYFIELVNNGRVSNQKLILNK